MRSQHQTTSFIGNLGRILFARLNYAQDVGEMIYISFRTALFEGQQSLKTVSAVVLSQIYFTGYQALALVAIIATATSGIIVMQSASSLNLLNDSQMVGQLLVAVVIREIAPTVTAMIVIARSGTAVASEIGNMRVNREIQALESMGINPLSYVVFPRLAGGIISVICLSLFFVYFAVLGGLIFAKLFLNMPFSYFTRMVLDQMTVSDIYLFIIKNVFSGAIIFTIACYQGLKVQASPHEVPQATTAAVMNSLLYVLMFNISATILFYINQIISMGLI